MLSRAMLREMGLIGQVIGSDLFQWERYEHKASPTSAMVVFQVLIRRAQYTQHELSTGMILPTDEKGLTPSAQLPFVPTVDDRVIKADDSRWLVMAFRGLEQLPFTVLQLRKGS